MLSKHDHTCSVVFLSFVFFQVSLGKFIIMTQMEVQASASGSVTVKRVVIGTSVRGRVTVDRFVQ